MASGPVPTDLTASERELLAVALGDWGGPAKPSAEVPALVGYADRRAFRGECKELASALRSGEPLLPRQWRAALGSLEIVWRSDTLGAGVEWTVVTGFTDVETLEMLRSIQRKLVAVVRR